MSSDLPRTIEPDKLADNEESLAGTLGLDAMPRLRALVSRPDGRVSFSLTFTRDETGRVVIGGQLDAALFLRCQRCLECLEVNLSNPIHIAWVSSQEEARELPGDMEPWLAEGRQTALHDIIEDEALLALPMAPLHEQSQCPAADTLQELRGQRENPFAVLEKLKTDKH